MRSPPSEESVRRGHEVRDVNPRVILWLGAGVLIMAAVVHVVLWLALGGMQWFAEQGDPPRSPLAAEAAEPPPPHLQDKPRQEYLDYRREQEEQLNSYGWVDREQRVVHIPIARAMDLIVEQGLPKPTAELDKPEREDQ